jgi:hypothetical protein
MDYYKISGVVYDYKLNIIISNIMMIKYTPI